MDPTEKEKVLKALCALGVDAESLASFDDEHLAKLSAAKYSTLGILRSARPEKLEMLLAPAHGLVDCILKAQGAAAGPGPGSAALAGAAAGPGPGGVAPAGPGYWLTAREAILRPLPGFNLRLSPRRSSSRTKATRPRTFSALAPWDRFNELLESVAGRLNNGERKYIPVMQAGDGAAMVGFNAAADECEVRAPMLNMAALVNDVAASMNIKAAIKGGGSGRSASGTDYVIQLLPDAQSDQQRQPAGVRQQPREMCSHNVYVCIEFKGHWQFPLELTHDVSTMTLEQLQDSKLDKALQQCYGDMIMDEAPLGMVTRHDVALLLMRSSKVEDKTLFVSPPIGLDRMLLALLALLHQAQQLTGVKRLLSRGKVPHTPPAGDPQERQLKRRRSARLQEQQQPAPWYDAVGGQVQGDEARQRSFCACGSGGASSGGSSGAISPDTDASDVGDASNIGMDTVSAMYVPLGGQVPEGLEELAVGTALPLELCGFGDVGLTGRCAGYGRYGNVLEGDIKGTAVVVKLFEQRRHGAVDAFARELAVYLRLASSSGNDVLGAKVPRLLRHGMFAHTGALFLALTDEGEDLEAGSGGAGGGGGTGGVGGSIDGRGAVITPELRASMVQALQALHRAGVLHGDIRLSNFVLGQDGGVKLVDLGEAKMVGGADAGSSHQAMAAEVQAVQAL